MRAFQRARRDYTILRALFLDTAGAKSDIADDSTLAVTVRIIEAKLGKETKLFIASADLLSAVKEEIPWIDTNKKLSGQLRKFQLESGRNPGGDKRGFTITRAWLDDVKARYVPVLPPDKASEVSEGIKNQQLRGDSEVSEDDGV